MKTITWQNLLRDVLTGAGWLLTDRLHGFEEKPNLTRVVLEQLRMDMATFLDMTWDGKLPKLDNQAVSEGHCPQCECDTRIESIGGTDPD